VRKRVARLFACVVGVAAAYGCYSSIAPTAMIDPGTQDSGLPPVPPGGKDACAPRRPWEGPGVTGVLPTGATSALVVSGDRYFVADIDTTSPDAADPTLGRVTAWHESGNLRALWSTAPRVIGLEPWDDPGVTAVYIDKATGTQVIISRFLRWVHNGDQWPVSGNITDEWIQNDAGPPALDGAVPWEGPGVTAGFFSPGGAQFTAVSKDKGWLRTTTDPDPRNWTWDPDGGFTLGSREPWASAPVIGGARPFDGNGVTTAYYVGPRFFVISVDKMWVYDGATWSSSGMLKDMPGWADAPAAPCN
jgi:hypothetical protein